MPKTSKGKKPSKKKPVKLLTKPIKKLVVKPKPTMKTNWLGDKEWFLNGLRHRIDGPAILRRDGSTAWYRHGKFHRLDGPAVEHSNGIKEWWVKGQRHRDGAPAFVGVRGVEEWYFKGALHRIGGPALIHGNSDKRWYVNGLLHREDGPAVENSYGSYYALRGREFYSKSEWLISKEALVEGI